MEMVFSVIEWMGPDFYKVRRNFFVFGGEREKEQ